MYLNISIFLISISVIAIVFILTIYFSMFSLENKYFKEKRECYYLLTNTLYMKKTNSEIKNNKCFNIAIQNKLIEEFNNIFIITEKGIQYLNHNNFIENTRMHIITIFTISISITNIILQFLLILK